MSIKIALIGKIRSGKDTFAEVFKEAGFVECKFSTGITNIIQDYFPEALLKGKPREHYQKIGQALREINPEVWVNYTLNNQILPALYKGDNIIVTDVRQPNEYNTLFGMGFVFIRIDASERIRIKRMEREGDQVDPKDLLHSTEMFLELFEADTRVLNEGSLEALRYKADRVLKTVLETGSEGEDSNI